MNKTEFKTYRQQRTNLLFCEELAQEVNTWCERQGLEPNTTSIIAYLVKHNIVRQSAINQYTALQVYPNFLEAEGGKEKAVCAMANLLPLEPRQIYNLLKNRYQKHSPNKIKFP
jgi:hypothetical protein